LLAALLFSAQSVAAKDFTFQYQRIIEPQGPVTLDLTYLEGNLEVVGGNEDGKLIINAVKRVKAVSMAEAEEVQGYIEIKVTRSDKQVSVRTNYLKMRNRGRSFWQKLLGLGEDDSYGEVDWRIELPDDCNLVVTNTSGRMNISHLRGSVGIRSSAADIALSSIEGDVRIDNSGGETHGDLLFGNIEVRQPQGVIDLKWIDGNVRVRSVSAAIAIVQEQGAIDITTTTGTVDIQTNLDSPRSFYVETESGNINLKIPESSSGKLNIVSQSGRIKTEIPISIQSMTRKQVVGDFGFGGVTISLSSVSGDVTVAQY